MREKDNQIALLERKARDIRRLIVQTAYECAYSPHIGPALSCADICTAIYYHFMKIDPQNPQKPDRDRFILSKGHASLVQYAILADMGFFPMEDLKTLRHVGSKLQGHPAYGKTAGVDMTTGSLGNGLGIGLGMAYYQKLQGIANHIFVILGDGELNEGVIWEAISIAPALKTDNLIAIVDRNCFQSCGATEDICPMPNLKSRWEAFGWKTLELNGHDMMEIVNKLEIAVHSFGPPVCLIADTVKGKGVSFMESNNAWHQKKMSAAEYSQAMSELQEV